jgi:hypothetical protein
VPAGNVIGFLWSYAFGFGLEGAFCCSFLFVVLAFVDSGQYPAFVLVDASAWQLYRFLFFSFLSQFSWVYHFGAIKPSIEHIAVLI